MGCIYLIISALMFTILSATPPTFPTPFVQAYSIFFRYAGNQTSYHWFIMNAISPNFIPDVKFNGRSIPHENITQWWFVGFVGWDTIPRVSPKAEANLEVIYKDLNEKEKSVKSKVKLPPEPSASVEITGDVIKVAWKKPDKKNVSFVYAGIHTICVDDTLGVKYIIIDTIITDVENVTYFSRTKSTMCDDAREPIYISAAGYVVYFYGAWSGSKNDINGQYYGAIGVGDTTSLINPLTSTEVNIAKYNYGLYFTIQKVEGSSIHFRGRTVWLERDIKEIINRMIKKVGYFVLIHAMRENR